MPEWNGTIEEEEQEMNADGWDAYDKHQAEQERINERLRASINGLSADDFYTDVMPSRALASDTQVGGNHYKNMAIQPSEYIFENGLNWLEGNAIKYITRHSIKGGVQDLDKAIHYLELLKEWQYGEA